jgi:hypothetical protein
MESNTADSRLSLKGAFRVAGLWSAWAAAVFLVAVAASRLPIVRPNFEFAKDWPLLARWDSGWYWQIATGGYHFDPKQLQNNTDFYPLYPVLVRIVSRASSIPVFDAGIAVSLALLLAGLLLFADLIRLWGEPEEAVLPSIAALLCFPAAFFFAAFYTESLFFFSTVLAVWGARRGLWLAAGIGAAASGMTRFNGFLVLIPVAAYAWVAWRRSGSPRGPLAALAMGAMGVVAYPLYLWRRFGDALLYVHDRARGGWPQRTGPPWRLLGNLLIEARQRITVGAPDGRLNFWVRLAVLLLFVGLTVLLAGRRRLPEALYLAATILLILGSGTLDGVHRFFLVLFPGFFALGDFLRKRPVAAFCYFFLAACVQTVLLVHFVNWIFVA